MTQDQAIAVALRLLKWEQSYLTKQITERKGAESEARRQLQEVEEASRALASGCREENSTVDKDSPPSQPPGA